MNMAPELMMVELRPYKIVPVKKTSKVSSLINFGTKTFSQLLIKAAKRLPNEPGNLWKDPKWASLKSSIQELPEHLR